MPAHATKIRLLIGVFTALTAALAAAQAPAQITPPGDFKVLTHLENPAVDESSGLAAGRLRPDILFTHNDSGDRARLYAFDRQGRDRGVFQIKGVKARDFEDMAAARINGLPVLMAADIGDNKQKRTQYQLYFVAEPQINAQTEVEAVAPIKTVTFQYEDGPHDCEAAALTPDGRTVFLIIKVVGLTSGVYQLDLTAAETQTATARKVADVFLPAVTGMDIAPNGRLAVVLTYGDAFLFRRDPDQSWARAFSAMPQTVRLPQRKQGEAVCFSPDGQSLYLTSEGRPAPLWQVDLQKRLP